MGEEDRVEIECSKAEVKLLVRLRQLRNLGKASVVLLRTEPLILSVVQNPEYLELVTSGSAVRERLEGRDYRM